jgi:phosphate:Na+ symporter
MGGQELFFLIFRVLGGLALFIFGMHIMTDGLKQAAGKRLRTILAKATRNGTAGITLGTSIGVLVQSSAATVMLVGFINAGLMTLAQSVPVMLGANVGTTIAMQLISFKLSAYCYFAITVGFVLQMVIANTKGKAAAKALMGFGLLFMGMSLMSETISPYREVLSPYLAHIDGKTLGGTLLGVGIATGITAIIQSSGATIGMVFAMISAGVITDLSGAYPIILGANIGTCMTALLGSIGTNIQARRSAISHLTFNVLSAIFGILTAPFFYWSMPYLTDDLIHQAANANMIKMVASALIVLPIYKLFARLVVLITPSRRIPPEPSFLDDSLLSRPERAIAAAIRELGRVAKICSGSLTMNAELFNGLNRRTIQAIRLNEQTINEVKLSMDDYLADMTRHYLSKRQSVLIQHVNRCMSNLERIGDHIDRIREITEARLKQEYTRFDKETLDHFFALYGAATVVLRLVIESMDPERRDFQQMAQSILSARDTYMQLSLEFKSMFNEKIATQGVGMAPIAGIYLTKYVDALDRIVKHAKTIALVESQPQFWIKRKKLRRIVEQAPAYEVPEKVDMTDYLDKLQSEEYM